MVRAGPLTLYRQFVAFWFSLRINADRAVASSAGAEPTARLLSKTFPQNDFSSTHL